MASNQTIEEKVRDIQADLKHYVILGVELLGAANNIGYKLTTLKKEAKEVGLAFIPLCRKHFLSPNRTPFDHSWLNKLMSVHKNWSIIENALHAKALPFEIQNNVEKVERWARDQAMTPEQRAKKQAKAEARKAAQESESDAESEQPTDAEKEALRAENGRLRRKLAESEAEKAKLREELLKKSTRSASAEPPRELTSAELAKVVAIYNRWTDGTTPGERDNAKGIFAGLADKFSRTVEELIAAVKASGNNYDRKAA